VLSSWQEATDYVTQSLPMVPFNNQSDMDMMIRNTFKSRDDGKLVFDWDRNVTKNLGQMNVSDLNLWRMFAALRRVPVLSVRGENSPFVTDALWDRMSQAVPHMMRVTVQDTGHAPKLTESICQSALNEWLKSGF